MARTGPTLLNKSNFTGGAQPGNATALGAAYQPLQPTAQAPGQSQPATLPNLGAASNAQHQNSSMPGDLSGTSQLNDINSFYGDLTNRQSQAWTAQQGLLNNQMGAGQRGAAEQNARMGRSIGGGFSQLQGQAQAQGMNEMQKAWLSYQDQANQTGQQWNQARTAEADKNLDWGRHQWDVNQQQAAAAAARAGETPSAGAGTPAGPAPIASNAANSSGGQNSIAAVINSNSVRLPSGQTVPLTQDQSFVVNNLANNLGYKSGPQSDRIKSEMYAYMAQEYSQTGKWPDKNRLTQRLKNLGLIQ